MTSRRSSIRRARQVALAFAAAGCLAALAVVATIASPELVPVAFGHWWAQILLGLYTVGIVTWALTPACLASHRANRGSLAGVRMALTALAVGALVPCLGGLLFGGSVFERDAIHDFVVKPMFWIVIFGSPWAALLGFLLDQAFRRIVGRQST